MKIRNEQNLLELDVTKSEYKEVANIYNDYKQLDDDLWATCDYDLAKHLNVGDELMLLNEDTGNLSPWMHSIELSDGIIDSKLLVVTRKIYSANGLDIYVVEADKYNI